MKRQKQIRFGALLRFLTRARKEVNPCAEAKAYLAGSVLLGAMTEYLLQTMLRMFSDVVYRRGRRMTDHSDLKKLNDFASECGWFDEEVDESAERIRRTKNPLHPNWYASGKPPRITGYMLEAREDDFERIYHCLVARVI